MDNYEFTFFPKGHPRLVNALAKLYSGEMGRTIDPMQEVLVTAGAYESLFVSIMGEVCTLQWGNLLLGLLKSESSITF